MREISGAAPENLTTLVDPSELALALESVPVPLLMLTPDSTVAWVNDAHVALSGHLREELVSRPFSQFVLDASSHRDELARLAAGEFVPDFQAGISAPDGTAIHVMIGGSRRLVHLQSVTEEMEHRQAAAELQERMVAIVEGSDDAIISKDLNGIIRSWNAAAERMFGYKSHEVIGESITMLAVPDRVSEIAIILDRIRRGERVEHYETRRRHKDGRVLTVSLTVSPVRDASGRIIGASKIARDITERKEGERERRLLSLLVDRSPEFIGISDLEGKPVYVNGAAVELVGASAAAEAQKLRVWEYFVPAERVFVRETVLPWALEHGRWQGELHFYHLETGEPIPVLYDVFRVDDPASGAATHFATITRDLRERKRAEAELRASRARLQQVFEQAPVAVAVLRGRDMVFELTNPAYERFFPGRELLGRPLLEVVPELDENLRRILSEVIETGRAFVANEYHVPLDRDQDGVVEDSWFTLLYHPLVEMDGTVSGIVAVASEVTEHVRARRELERVNRELEEFAYISSHDLKEPLRMVNVYTQLLVKRRLVDSEEANSYAEIITQGVRRMEALIDDVLSYSRVIHAETEAGAIDLSAVLAEVLTNLKVQIEESGAQIRTMVLPWVRGERLALTHVFQNLLSNSLKYRQPDVPLDIVIAAERRGAEALISVCDNGIGFDQQYADRIFGLFKRLHSDAYPGTGLGLAVCKRIVERYGGRIWAESKRNEGATFYFTLPAA